MGDVQFGRWHGARGKEWNVGKWSVLCLPNFKLYGLFVRTLISLTNAYASCSRLTLNFIECLWLGSVRSALILNSKPYSNELWNELHNHAQMYRNVLQIMYSKRPKYTGECQSCYLFMISMMQYWVQVEINSCLLVLTSPSLYWLWTWVNTSVSIIFPKFWEKKVSLHNPFRMEKFALIYIILLS